MCDSLALLAILTVIAATALPLIRSDAWWIRWFDFPRLQLLLLGLILIGLWKLWYVPGRLFRTALLCGLVLSTAYQAFRIYPYTRLSGVQVENAANEHGLVIRLVTANVLMHNRQAEKYLRVLEEANPDIILTTEADPWWSEKLNVLDASYPHQVKYPLTNTYGMILHSRFPLIDPSVKFLIEAGIPSIHCSFRLPGNYAIQFVGLHPRPPGPTENEETTERDAELIMVGKSARRSDLPFMVLGDLNDVAWSRTTALFQKISGLLDPRVGRGMHNTYHADYAFIRFPLDHLFHSTHFKIIEMKRLAHIGSDHFPFYAALSFRPRQNSSWRPPAPTRQEKQHAEDILEDAL